MLYQVILTDGELELLKESLDTACVHYDEYGQVEAGYQVKQLIKSIKFSTMKF